MELSTLLQTIFLLTTLQQTFTIEDAYLRYVKDDCFIKGEALSCVKYKAIKIAQKTIFGDRSNETIKANDIISLVPLDRETIERLGVNDDKEIVGDEPRSFLSEWTEVAKYFMKVMQDFFKMKGLRVTLPEGARAVEDEVEDARGKRKKLAVIVPLLTLMAAMKIKMMLIPILLSVMLIKKLLLIAALLLPSLLSTLKACKQQHHPMTHYSYFGSSDANDYSADYGSNYAYSSGGGYGKDWASNRAYKPMKLRPTATPTYITAPGAVV